MVMIKDITKQAGLRTAVFSFEPMCVVVIIAIQFKSANQRPQNLWLKGQEIVVSLCGHRKCYKKGKILSSIINQSDSCCLPAYFSCEPKLNVSK